MKRVISFCDCHPEGTDVEATHLDVSIKLGTEYDGLLDLCDPDYAKLMKAVRPYVEASRKPDSFDKAKVKATPREKAPCPHCGSVQSQGAGMAIHTKSKHPEAWQRELERREGLVLANA